MGAYSLSHVYSEAGSQVVMSLALNQFPDKYFGIRKNKSKLGGGGACL